MMNVLVYPELNESRTKSMLWYLVEHISRAETVPRQSAEYLARVAKWSVSLTTNDCPWKFLPRVGWTSLLTMAVHSLKIENKKSSLLLLFFFLIIQVFARLILEADDLFIVAIWYLV